MGAAAPIAGGLSLASAGLSAFNTINKGRGEDAAADFRAQQSERAARYGRLRADQIGGQLQEQETSLLGNIDVIRAAAGADPTSPTSAALRERAEYLSGRQRSTTVDSILAQASQDEADADYMRKAGKFALKQSYLQAAGGLLDKGSKMFGGGFGGAPTGGGTGFSLKGTGGLY